jgi:glycerol uptake facilitator-like aquaporin
MEYTAPLVKSAVSLVRALFYEFLGSMALTYAFNASGRDYFSRALCYFTFWVLAFAVSGAHFNPAISLGVYLSEGKLGGGLVRLILYWFF